MTNIFDLTSKSSGLINKRAQDEFACSTEMQKDRSVCLSAVVLGKSVAHLLNGGLSSRFPRILSPIKYYQNIEYHLHDYRHFYFEKTSTFESLWYMPNMEREIMLQMVPVKSRQVLTFEMFMRSKGRQFRSFALFVLAASLRNPGHIFLHTMSMGDL